MGDRSTFGPRWSRDGFWEGILQYRADSRPGILTPRDTLNISKFASRGGFHAFGTRCSKHTIDRWRLQDL